MRKKILQLNLLSILGTEMRRSFMKREGKSLVGDMQQYTTYNRNMASIGYKKIAHIDEWQ